MPFDPGTAAVVGYAANAAGNIFTARKQRKWNEKMWHAKNAYDHPAKQMERFREAGLNPNLVYGQGTPGNAGQAQGYQRAQFTGNPMAEYQTWKMTEAQIDLIKEQTDKTGQEVEYINQKTLKEKVLTEIGDYQAQELVRTLHARDLSWSDLTEVVNKGIATVRDVEQFGVISGMKNRAEYQQLKEQELDQLLKWINANNLSKWAAPILQLFKMML